VAALTAWSSEAQRTAARVGTGYLVDACAAVYNGLITSAIKLAIKLTIKLVKT